MRKIKLFCIPYAGGSAMVYSQWIKKIHDNIEIVPIELKGRGIRVNEGHYNSINEMIEDVFQSIIDRIEGSDYAIFGHSMGSIVAFETYHKIVEKGIKKPKHMFFSGRKVPALEKKNECENLTDEGFIETIKSYGGLSEELLGSDEMMKYFMPILRNDFNILEEYHYDEKNPIDVECSIFLGKDDSITVYEALEWKDYIDNNCQVYVFNGGHFFIKDNISEVTRKINEILKKEWAYE